MLCVFYHNKKNGKKKGGDKNPTQGLASTGSGPGVGLEGQWGKIELPGLRGQAVCGEQGPRGKLVVSAARGISFAEVRSRGRAGNGVFRVNRDTPGTGQDPSEGK